ncbi:MarR family transcriptional regulator [Mycetocola lacteus]|uniref:MarR family transcriptional regulator n=1 Tax=Mycetocola lacteus TaxID=76637 RepID=A0A3L7AY40_9MICO|nr:MarR family transcriptional regulator [Mycetocola lacteus]RLP84082.1 MarR family transcriptional regulator [Mycetocola lacteus]
MEDLTPDENTLWRALMKLNSELPPILDQDLVHAAGLTLSEFAVLLTLDEAEAGELRMNQIAASCGLSPSRVTRVVAVLERRGLAEKRRSDVDARGAVAAMSDAGRERLRRAYPVQVDRARALLFDHLDADQVRALGTALDALLNRTIEAAGPEE